jgi:hypothetical protein
MRKITFTSVHEHQELILSKLQPLMDLKYARLGLLDP